MAMLAGGTTLIVLGQYQACSWIKVRTPASKEGWVSGDAVFVTLETDCGLIQSAPFRPASGSVLLDQRAAIGGGQLTVQNSGSLDAVFVLTDSVGKALTAVYVQSGQNYTLDKLADGSYQFYYTRGQNWDGTFQRFQQIAEVKKLDDQVAFTTSGTTYTTWTVSLEPGEGSAQRSSDVSLDQFPVIK
jgi:hypothetical protein